MLQEPFLRTSLDAAPQGSPLWRILRRARLVRKRQAQKRNRTSPNFLPAQAPSGAGRGNIRALLILRAGNFALLTEGHPCKWGPG